jgi:methionine-rich copper-binding protein CopC
MNKVILILLTGFYLNCASIAQAVADSSVPSDNSYEPTAPERILVLYDNPMEEHTLINVVVARGYDIKNEKELAAAIEVLKKESAKAGAHAVIVLPPEYNDNSKPGINQVGDIKILSGKAIRYKHFYY